MRLTPARQQSRLIAVVGRGAVGLKSDASAALVGRELVNLRHLAGMHRSPRRVWCPRLAQRALHVEPPPLWVPADSSKATARAAELSRGTVRRHVRNDADVVEAERIDHAEMRRRLSGRIASVFMTSGSRQQSNAP